MFLLHKQQLANYKYNLFNQRSAGTETHKDQYKINTSRTTTATYTHTLEDGLANTLIYFFF